MLLVRGSVVKSHDLATANVLQALRSYKLTITVDPKYHPKIIGRKGAIITNIRTEHDVNIQFPEKNDENQVLIVVLQA